MILSNGTSSSNPAATHGPPNQNVGMARISVVIAISEETLFIEAVLAVFNKTKATVALTTPIRIPIAIPTATKAWLLVKHTDFGSVKAEPG